MVLRQKFQNAAERRERLVPFSGGKDAPQRVVPRIPQAALHRIAAKRVHRGIAHDRDAAQPDRLAHARAAFGQKTLPHQHVVGSGNANMYGLHGLSPF